MAKKKVPPKPKTCPKCGGTTDTFNKCIQCGRLWTPKLTAEERAEIEQHEIRKATRKAKPKPKPAKKAFDEPEFKQWEVLPTDSETEVVRKRALMRLESRRTYDRMGLAVKSSTAQRDVLKWFSRLWGVLDEGEREALTPIAKALGGLAAALNGFAREKIRVMAAMEKQLEEAYRDARKARINANNKRRKATVAIKPGEDTEGFSAPEPVKLDPQELLEQVKKNLEKPAKGVIGDNKDNY